MLTPNDLRCEYAANPLGIGTSRPRLGWKLDHPERGQVQTAYQIIAALKPGFVSRTADGHKLGNKKDFPDAPYCFAFRMSGKTLITVGDKKAGLSERTKNPLEIVAMTPPADLKVGDTLPLKVMFEGKPLSGASVNAVYEGFTEEKHHWTQEAETNADGLVQMKLTAKGPWLFATSHKESYADKAECDDYSYRASLTVGF